MSSPRALETRLRAWRSFRDVAQATRSLSGSMVLRWGHAATAAEAHLARVSAFRAGVRAGLRELPAPGPEVVVAFGSDTGLCGRLNQLVAEAARVELAGRTPRLVVLLGWRLQELLPEVLAQHLPAPGGPEAAADLAERLEAELRQVSPVGAPRLRLIAAVEVEPGGTPRIATEGDEPLAAAATSAGRLLTPPLQALAPAEWLWVHARLARMACRAGASEAAVRLAAMTQAQEAAERRIAEQERDLRKLRQEQITQEMLEVVSERARGTR